jgi:hypothetical protein
MNEIKQKEKKEPAHTQQTMIIFIYTLQNLEKTKITAH